MNNVGILIQAIKNPENLVNKVINNSQFMANPIAKNAIEMYKQGDKEGINKMAENLCKEKGIKPEEVINRIKSTFEL